jgi:type I restriction enzyme S subunit
VGLKAYPAYRESGVPWLGEVPEHWEVLPAMAAYRPKQVKNVGLVEATVLSLSYGRIIVKPPEKVRGLVPESFETYQIVDPGDIVVRTTDLQNDHTSLRVGYARDRGIITSAYLCLTTTSLVNTEFGYQFLNAYDLLKIIYGFGSGLRQNLDFGEIKRMPVLIPPKAEQAIIVRFLDHLDQQIRCYIRSKQKLIKLLDERRFAKISRAVTFGIDPNVNVKPTGLEWLAEMPAHWSLEPFKRSAIEYADYRGATPTKTDHGVFLVTAKNVRKGSIDYEVSREYVAESDYSEVMRRGLPKLGDLLLTMEAPLGNAALVDRERVALAQRVVRFRFSASQFEPRFVLCSVLAPYFQDQLLCRGTGSTAVGIKASKLPQLRILCPPIAEQRAILGAIDRASRTDLLAASAKRQIELIREYRTRLIADVVTGKLDVREAAAQLPEEIEEVEAVDEADAIADTDDEMDQELEPEEVGA